MSLKPIPFTFFLLVNIIIIYSSFNQIPRYHAKFCIYSNLQYSFCRSCHLCLSNAFQILSLLCISGATQLLDTIRTGNPDFAIEIYYVWRHIPATLVTFFLLQVYQYFLAADFHICPESSSLPLLVSFLRPQIECHFIETPS